MRPSTSAARVGLALVVVVVVVVAAAAACSSGDEPSPAPSTPLPPSTAPTAGPTPGPTGPSPATTTPASTAQRRIEVDPASPVTGTVTGTCFTTSVADPTRPDAYRCTTDDQPSPLLLDPCLTVPGRPDELRCLPDPFAPGVRLVLAAPLPGPLPGGLAPTEPMPWAVRTADGVLCVARGGGTAPMVAGGFATYECGADGAEGVLLDPLDTSTPLWRAPYVPPGADSARTVVLSEAYT